MTWRLHLLLRRRGGHSNREPGAASSRHWRYAGRAEVVGAADGGGHLVALEGATWKPDPDDHVADPWWLHDTSRDLAPAGNP